jgi:hypothetical protein
MHRIILVGCGLAVAVATALAPAKATFKAANGLIALPRSHPNTKGELKCAS